MIVFRKVPIRYELLFVFLWGLGIVLFGLMEKFEEGQTAYALLLCIFVPIYVRITIGRKERDFYLQRPKLRVNMWDVRDQPLVFYTQAAVLGIVCALGLLAGEVIKHGFRLSGPWFFCLSASVAMLAGVGISLLLFSDYLEDRQGEESEDEGEA